MKQPVSTMLKHSRASARASTQASNRAYAPAMLADAPSNAHTYRQTYKHQLTKRNYPRLSNARRGAARFRRIWGGTSRTACAARGPERPAGLLGHQPPRHWVGARIVTAHAPQDATNPGGRIPQGGLDTHRGSQTHLPNPRIGLDDDGTLDDFFATDVESVHFEAMDESHWWACIRLRNGEEWDLNFGARNRRAKGYARAEQV